MIRFFPEQLKAQLKERLSPCYMLFGNDPLLLQESQSCIRTYAETLQFNKYISVVLDTTTDWEAIFDTCQTFNLFSNRQTLLLILPENSVHAVIGEKLSVLTSLLHDDLLVILRGHKLDRALKNSVWFKEIGRAHV